jgi:cytochrome c oxidase cbb3-type subunit 1
MNSSSPAVSSNANAGASTPAIDTSGRGPVLFLFASALLWLTLSSMLGLIASLKFHMPGLLADCAWLTYGRVHPAQTNSFIYGFAAQAGLGVTLWILGRLGRAPLALPGAVTFGAAFWNLGVTLGVLGILGGGNTGFEWLEMPAYAPPILFCAYLLIGFGAMFTFHNRAERSLYVSQWFLFAALLWFPWIYSTANLLLVVAPVRGTLQATIDWWYAHNLRVIWFGFIGLAALFYFIPKIGGRPLHSYALAMIAFWLLALFGSWGGIHPGAPVPAWIPSVSTVATVFTLVPLIAVGLNLHRTLAGEPATGEEEAPFRFLVFGAGAYLLAALLGIVQSLREVSAVLHFTLFTVAQKQLELYGFFAMTMFGAMYYIVPRLVKGGWPSAGLVKLHYGCAVAGVSLFALPLLIGGVLQGLALNDAAIPFMNALKRGLLFYRIATLGEVLMAVGNLAMFWNLVLLLKQFCPICGAATAAEPKTAEVPA